MGRDDTFRVIEPSHREPAFPLPALSRKRPRAFEEWEALCRWGRLGHEERNVPGYQLRLARERAGLSQQELAVRLGCSQQAVSQAERWSANPTVRFIEAWARATKSRLVLELVNHETHAAGAGSTS